MSCYYVSGIAMNIVEIYPRFWDLHTLPDGGGGGLITRTPLVDIFDMSYDDLNSGKVRSLFVDQILRNGVKGVCSSIMLMNIATRE